MLKTAHAMIEVLIKIYGGSTRVLHQVKNLVLSQLWHRLQLWWVLSLAWKLPHAEGVSHTHHPQKKKKKKNNELILPNTQRD